MSSFLEELQEIKTLISSKSNKSLAYSTLLRLLEQSSDDPSSIQTLAQSSRSLISLIVADISHDDEEIAAQALKCLGFMIYHPSLVVMIPVDDVSLTLESLAKLITGTKIKSVCNLGVWCLSIQQFNVLFLALHFPSLLQAVVHAIDNPIGSLSTTFEAIQAVIKLAAQLGDKMRESSHIWAPPMCRRLLSIDKRERDMSERCLLKLRSTIFPPLPALSKAVVKDMRRYLLPEMRDMLNRGMKVQALQAWGWFIRLLGSHVMKNRHLINDMLKVPEETFSDHSPQVQMASLASWEGLIDALIHPPMLAGKTNASLENGNSCEIQTRGFLKSIKLIMTPIIGIIRSKCDVSVQSSCFDTWCYLLHKLDTSINNLPVKTLVLDPIFETVFHKGPDNRGIRLWNLCLDLLDESILVKSKGEDSRIDGQRSYHLSARTTMLRSSVSVKCSSMKYLIKWLPWDLSQLDFYVKITDIIVSHASVTTVTPENRSLACGAALRIFRSILKGIQVELRNPSNNYDDIMLCLNKILRFTKKICEEVNVQGSGCNDLCHASLWFVEAVMEELEPSVLGSTLYKVTLDLKYIEKLQSLHEIKLGKVLLGKSITYMDTVSPIVYLIALYICVMFQQTSKVSKMELIPLELDRFFKFILSSYDPLENLLAFICLLYKHIGFDNIKFWIATAEGLKDCIDGVKDFLLMTTEPDSAGYTAIRYLFSYPFILWFSHQRELSPVDTSDVLEEWLVSSQRKFELGPIVKAWKSLYGSVIASAFECSATNNFPEDLCAMLNGCLDESISMLEFDTGHSLSYKVLGVDFLSLLGEVLICVLEQSFTLGIISNGSKNKHDHYLQVYSSINSVLGLASRFLKLSWMKIRAEAPTGFILISRVISVMACFTSCLYFKQNILTFFEVMSCPLLQWLSVIEMQEESIKNSLLVLWAETLNCLQRSQPPIIFDSSFLKFQACLLEKTLDHPNSSISEPTITFWNSTYGKQNKLDYPRNLLNVLDKLSRTGRIKLQLRSLPTFKRFNSGEDFAVPQRCKVTSTTNRSSKRVRLIQNTENKSEKDKLSSGLKRKKLELTEHQKEVRRAQQGRERDCNGHGPGIRTYTSVDFSQGHEDSQESQDIRNPESILKMLVRAT